MVLGEQLRRSARAGDNTDRLVPTRVGAGVDWVRVSAGGFHTCGVRSDRSLWCWGHGDYGELGLGDRTDRLVPTRVGSEVDWARVSANISGHTCGVRTDRSLWCWGNNRLGQLGLGDRTRRLVPTLVGAGVQWASVSGGAGHTCGVRTDLSLWCWGWNSSGQLGLGDTRKRLVPRRV